MMGLVGKLFNLGTDALMLYGLYTYAVPFISDNTGVNEEYLVYALIVLGVVMAFSVFRSKDG